MKSNTRITKPAAAVPVSREDLEKLVAETVTAQTEMEGFIAQRDKLELAAKEAQYQKAP